MKTALPALPQLTEEIADELLTGALKIIGDASFAPVSRGRVLERYRRAGHEIADMADIRALDVAVPDDLTRGLARRWMVAAGGLGGAVGTLGAPGFVVDVPALLATNLMAIGECACTYGFDVVEEDEHAFAIALLLAKRKRRLSGRSDVRDAIDEVRDGAGQIRGGATRPRGTSATIGTWVRAAAWRLARRLVRRKLGQLVPFVGAVVGAAVDADFTHQTCEIARRVYHRRFLDEFGA